jgi:DNA replication protein DnaC
MSAFTRKNKELANSSDLESRIIYHANLLGLSAIGRYKAAIDPGKGTFEENLAALLEAQSHETLRHRLARRAKTAGITVAKTLDMLDMSERYLPKLDRGEIDRLAACEFIDAKQNVVAIGPPGTGKTHLAIAVGLEAIKREYSVKFKSASAMVDEMWEAKSDKRLTEYTKSLLRCELLIIDELGYIGYDAAHADLLFKIISARNESRSTFITTNYVFSEWDKFIKDKTQAAAMVSRFANNSAILNTTGGKDYRLDNAGRGKKA